MELYGSLTTKEIKKTHSSRLVGGVEMGSRAEGTCGKAVAGGLGQARWQVVDQAVPHVCADKVGGTTGERDRLHNTGLQHREIKLQNL